MAAIIYPQTDEAPLLATYSFLPVVSASVPQLRAAIKELQAKGYDLPDYPESPSTPEQTVRP